MYGQNNGYYMPYQNPYMNGAVPDMLNQAKMQYAQPMMQQPVQMQTPTQIKNDMLWVLNENEATSYPVAPNNSVVLWDKSNPTIYVKSVNAQGVPSIRILDFTERTENADKSTQKHTCTCGDKFVTKEQLRALQSDIDNLTAKYNDLIEKQSAKTIKTSKKEAE